MNKILFLFLFFCWATAFPQTKDFHTWAATPPMGWNSWDCFGPNVIESEVKANADYMAKNLKKFGWEYIIVDIRWYVSNDKPHGYNQTDPDYVLDSYGRFLPAVKKFPSAANGKGFKPLADYIHSKGLKFGFHIMRGVPVEAVKRKLPILSSNVNTSDIYTTQGQCGWLRDMYTILNKEGAQEYYNSLFNLYASWGTDFVKVDDLSIPYHKEEVEMIRRAIDQCGRKIVLSTSPGETPIAEAKHVQDHANMWRTVGDFWDNWGQLKDHFAVFERWNPYRINGGWPDGDMLPLGHIGIRAERGDDRMAAFTKDEQYTVMTLWSIFRSPLMFGGHLPDNDPFTLALLTNKEIMNVARNSINNKPLFRNGKSAAWLADDPATGDKYLAVFNLADPQEAIESKAVWNSGIITKTTPGQSKKIDIDISGAKKLYLAVLDGGDDLAWDFADWISPAIYKGKDSVLLTSIRPVRSTSGAGRVRNNLSAAASLLNVNDIVYPNGIGVASNSVLEFNIPEGYTRFKALAGVDKAAADQNTGCTVQFLVATVDPAGPPLPAQASVAVQLSQLGLSSARVKDLWSGKDLGIISGTFSPVIGKHGAALYRLSKIK